MTSKKSYWYSNGIGELKELNTQEKIKTYVRTLIKRYNGYFEEPLSEEDFAFMLELLSHHPQWDSKKGAGVEYMTTRHTDYSTPKKPNICIYLHRADGTEVDISWGDCLLNNGTGSVKKEVTKAARFEVFTQTQAFSASVPHGTPCPICMNPLEMGDRHVDHYAPQFEELFSEFLLGTGMSIDTVEVVDAGPYDGQFKDRDLAERWQNYHQHRAMLRVIHPKENLERPRND